MRPTKRTRTMLVLALMWPTAASPIRPTGSALTTEDADGVREQTDSSYSMSFVKTCQLGAGFDITRGCVGSAISFDVHDKCRIEHSNIAPDAAMERLQQTETAHETVHEQDDATVPAATDPAKACVQYGSSNEQRVNDKVITSVVEQERFVSQAASIEGSGWGAEASASVSAMQHSRMSDRSISAVVAASCPSLSQRFIMNRVNLHLTSAARELLEKDPAQFLKNYGTGYVAQIDSGGSFAGTFTLTTSEAESKKEFEAAAKLEASYAGFGGSTHGSTQNTQSSQSLMKTVVSDLHFIGGTLPDILSAETNVKTQIAPKSPSEMKYVRDAWLAKIKESPEAQQEIRMSIRPWSDLVEVQQVLQSKTDVDEATRGIFYQPLPNREIVTAMNNEYLALTRVGWDLERISDMVRDVFFKTLWKSKGYSDANIAIAIEDVGRMKRELAAYFSMFNDWTSADLSAIAAQYEKAGLNFESLDTIKMPSKYGSFKGRKPGTPADGDYDLRADHKNENEDVLVFNAKTLEEQADAFERHWRPDYACTCKPAWKDGCDACGENDEPAPCTCPMIVDKDTCVGESWCDWKKYGQ